MQPSVVGASRAGLSFRTIAAVVLVASLLQSGAALAASSASEAPEKKVSRGKMTFAPKSLSFGRVQEGTTSQMSVSLTNASKVAIDITKISTTGAGFSAAQNCLDTLAATTGACQVVVTFAPAAAKKRQGDQGYRHADNQR